MALAALRELGGAEADAWFEALPRPQRLCSLSPAFVRADVHRAPGLRCIHVGYQAQGHRWLHSFHLREVPGHGWAAASAYGYGGPLSTSADATFIAGAWAAYTEWARANGVLGEFCRFHPEAGHETFFGGEVRANRLTISVDLTVAPVEAQFNTLARRKLRRAQGVPVRWSSALADWKAFGPFYRRAMAAMGAHERYHFGDPYFAALAQVPGARLCICGVDGAWCSAGVYLFQQRCPADQGPGGTLEYHLGASSAEGHETGTAYRIQHAAACEGQRLGLVNLYLGGGTTPASDNPLLFYKRAFSRRERMFHVGNAIHDAAAFERLARARGYHPGSAPPNLLFD